VTDAVFKLDDDVPDARMTPLEHARTVFRRWLHLPDTGVVDVVLGAVAANRLAGDPVWLLIVGPPGGGKSETLGSISGLSDVYPTGTLTEAALLSGTPKKEHASDAKGGLLRAIGDTGIIVCKDFGSVLSMNRDARASVLAALREIFDGSWTRHVGTDGGKTLHWQGRVGLIGGVTPTIDRHHAVMGAMGERFAFYRLPLADAKLQAKQALEHAGREETMRQELAGAVRDALADLREPRGRTDEETDRLISLVTLVVRARSAVERDGYSREIELVPGSEAPTRLIIVLDRLLAGLDAVGCERAQALALVTKVAFDSVPALRLAVLRSLQSGTLDTNQVVDAVKHPGQTTRRTLEDLAAHGLVTYERGGGPKDPHRWSLTPFAADGLECFPEKSDGAGQVCVPETSEHAESPFSSVPRQEPTFRESTNGHHDDFDIPFHIPSNDNSIRTPSRPDDWLALATDTQLDEINQAELERLEQLGDNLDLRTTNTTSP
jgi:hypothetical protein